MHSLNRIITADMKTLFDKTTLGHRTLKNHRTDRYGGDQRGCSRILYEILKDMRSKTGADFLITMKINSCYRTPSHQCIFNLRAQSTTT